MDLRWETLDFRRHNLEGSDRSTVFHRRNKVVKYAPDLVKHLKRGLKSASAGVTAHPGVPFPLYRVGWASSARLYAKCCAGSEPS